MTEKTQEDIRNGITAEEQAKKDTDALVVDENNDTIDVYDLLAQNKSDIAVVKINRLIEHGNVPIEMVAEKYSEVAGSITNKDLALMALDSVFIDLALSVTAKPNGIVIDLSTGLKDEELSKIQAEELGMDSDDYSLPNSSREAIVRLSIERSLEKYRENREAKLSEANRTFLELKEKDANYRGRSVAFNAAQDRFRKTHTYTERQQERDKKVYEELNYDKAVQDGIVGAKKKVIETDPTLIMLIELVEKTNKAKGNPAFNVQLAKLNKFLEQDPERYEILSQIMDKDREILPEYRAQAKEYRDNLGIKAFFEKTQYLTEDDIQYLSKSDKQELYMNFVASFKQLGAQNKFYGQIIENIQKIFPEISGIIKENKKIDTSKLFEFTQEVLELDKPLNSRSFAKLMNACQQELLNRQYHESQLNKKLDAKIKNNLSENKIPEEEIDKAFQENAIDLHIDLNAVLQDDGKKTDEEKYFENSKIVDFSTRIDAGNLKKRYKQFNSISWISKKETAVRLSFLSLAKLKESLEELSNDSPFYAQKLAEVEEKMESVKQSNSNIDFNQYLGKKGKVAKEYEKEISKYEESKITEKILYDFITDEEVVKSREDYDKLSKEDKHEYLLNSIAILQNRKNMKSTISKFVARRLEIIDIGENNLVSLGEDEEGNKVPIINENGLLEEYNKISSHKFESFEELKQYTEIKKLEYVSDKLEEYSSLRDEDFFELHGETHTKRSDEIENIRMNFNLRQRDESNKGEQSPKSKVEARKKTIPQSFEDNEETSEREENFVENNEQTALTVTDKKPSFFDRLKNVFSMITNLTTKAVDTFTNSSKENRKNGFEETESTLEKSAIFTERIDGNVQNAIEEFNASKGTENSRTNEAQVSIEDEESR